MSSNAYRGALLGVLAALLLVNPAYVGLAVDDPEPRSSRGYTATEVDPTNVTDQRLLVRRFGDSAVLSVDEFADANEYSPYGPRYRTPRESAALLRTATEEGTTGTDSDRVAFTLERVGASHRFLRVGDDPAQYYRFDVTTEDERTLVTTEAVNRWTVARHVFHANARLYSSLPGYQRETVDAVVAAEDYYRPTNDEFHEVTESVVVDGERYYVFSASVSVDDFGPSTRGLVSLVLSGLGALALLGSVAFTLEATRQRRDA